MNWDEYFIEIAESVARKSKDPSTKVGAVVVDKNHRIVSTGYNGNIQGANESELPLDVRPLKYHLVIHAEMNAILFAKKDLEGCTLYTTYAPCENCLKHALQAGIKRFIYKNVYVNSAGQRKSMLNADSLDAIKHMIKATKCEVRSLDGISWLEQVSEFEDPTEVYEIMSLLESPDPCKDIPEHEFNRWRTLRQQKNYSKFLELIKTDRKRYHQAQDNFIMFVAQDWRGIIPTNDEIHTLEELAKDKDKYLAEDAKDTLEGLFNV